uniref:ATP synthase F0 subunit 8 n=1 Tax=Ornithodoros asperus TaxID=1453431 RepID=UPI002237E591|nr:ATP synthase F0 subunit 8 [Ornithodoros asperus]UYB78746.1 ATP synthase F0 subunit 8 [Ornithodoros asperus]UYB78759.1 ATP synthase F0 subunit 8 [Ornithodoros asperus]
MPQIYPMNWNLLLTFFLINVLIILMFLYFVPLKYLFKSDKITKTLLSKNWKW